MGYTSQVRLQRVAEIAASRKIDSTRHKCFISYHAADTDEVAQFLDDFGSEFIGKTIGVTDEDDFIDSDESDYIMDRIRRDYLGDSSVTILMVGSCTWARRYVDWEIASSLRNSKHSKMNGLLGIRLPSVGHINPTLPARFDDNIKRDSAGSNLGYARYISYPTSKADLRSYIGDAFSARTSRAHLKVNTRVRRVRSAACP